MSANLEGKCLLVDGLNFFPYSYETEQNIGIPMKHSPNWKEIHSGIHFRVFAASAKAFNFTYEMMKSFEEPYDVHLFAPYSEERIIDKGPVTWTSGIKFVVGHPKKRFPWNALFLPLQRNVWLGCILVYGVIVFTIGLTTYSQSGFKFNKFIWEAVGVLPLALVMEQGLKIPSHLRLLSLTLLVGCTVLVTGYRSTLRQHLMFPAPVPIPRTFEELAEMTHYKVTLCAGEGELSAFKHSYNPLIKLLGHRVKTGFYHECAIRCLEELILGYNISCISWDDILLPQSAKMFHLNFTVDPLIYSTETYLNGMNSFGFQKNSIYTDSFSIILGLTRDMGIIRKWWEEDMDHLKKQGRRKLIKEKNETELFQKLLHLGRKQDEKNPLTVENLDKAFYFLVFGYIFGLLPFCIEFMTRFESVKVRPYSGSGEIEGPRPISLWDSFRSKTKVMPISDPQDRTLWYKIH